MYVDVAILVCCKSMFVARLQFVIWVLLLLGDIIVVHICSFSQSYDLNFNLFSVLACDVPLDSSRFFLEHFIFLFIYLTLRSTRITKVELS